MTRDQACRGFRNGLDSLDDENIGEAAANLKTDALGVVAKARGMSQVARDAGVTREALYKSLSEKGDPKLSTLIGVAAALGYKLTATPVAASDIRDERRSA